MKNKILSYLLGSIIVLSTGFITSYVDAQGDEEQTGGGCDCSRITDSEAQYKCMQQCSEKGKKECKDGCCGIKLNTNFPGIGNCITVSKGNANPTNVFPGMMGALTKLIMSTIFVVCFIMIIIAGIMRAGAGEDSSQKTKAKDLIKKVAITILLLGFSGAILRLINPNFFG